MRIRRFATTALATACAFAAALPPARAADAAETALPAPLTLEAAAAFAAEHSPALRQAREQIREQEGVLIQVQAARSPTLHLTGRYGQMRHELVQIPGYVDASWQLKLTAVKVLYAGGAIRAGIDAQAEQLEAARLAYTAREQDVMLAVHECFYSVLLDRELVAVRAEAVAVLETVLANARHRHDAGLGSQFDVIRAEASLANAQPALIRARNNYRVVQDRLCRLLGVPAAPGERADLGVAGEFPREAAARPLAEVLARARAQRAELRLQEHAVAAATHGLAASSAGYRPTVSSYAGYELTNDYTSRRFGDTIPGWTFGLQSDWALFDGRATAGKVAQARSRQRQARLAADDLALSIDLEVRESHAAVAEAEQVLAAATQTVAEATESLRLAKASEQEGMATQLDVLTAQSALTEARATLSHARFGCAVTAARLHRATGDPAAAL